jgi:xanthine dehydrogenase accessory factor
VEQDQLTSALDADIIPVLVDPNADVLLSSFFFPILIDARLTKQPPPPLPKPVALHIGLGPGFHAGHNCDAVIETRRSHTLGRVYWDGAAQPDSGQPEGDPKRVLRAPEDGIFTSHKKIGDHCEPGERIGEIKLNIGQQIAKIESPLRGVLRGIIRDGVAVTKGLKIGDVDPRDDSRACSLVSDKALAIGGGVLEAILSRVDIRRQLWPSPSTESAPSPNLPKIK